eukprot:scaffold122_cov387-Prasinococcus_capsulatus_cf.AAC.1
MQHHGHVSFAPPPPGAPIQRPNIPPPLLQEPTQGGHLWRGPQLPTRAAERPPESLAEAAGAPATGRSGGVTKPSRFPPGPVARPAGVLAERSDRATTPRA